MEVKVDLSAAANIYNTKKQPMNAKSKPDGSFLNVGDETTRVGKDLESFTDRLAEAFKTDNADIIRALDGLSEQDKMEIAMRSYFQMQGRVMSIQSKEEADIKAFGALKDEKAYYSSLMEEAEKNGTAKLSGDKRGSYAFADKAVGTELTKDDIGKALDDVQERIDKFLYPYGKNEDGTAISDPNNERITRDYIAYAAVFEEVTGLKADCLDPGDSLLLHKLDRTEDNFIEKARENISDLKGMSKDLRDLMKRYKEEQSEEIGGGDLSEEARARMEAFDYVREQFIGGGNDIELKTLGILNTQA